MAIAYNTSIVRDGLVLYLDAANRKSAKSQKSNILSWNDWISGTTGSVTSTGSWPTYSANGDGNSRVIDTNPFGTSDVVWDVSNQDAASDADGGWDSTSFPIDPTKTYRFSTWIRRKTIGNGSTYLGVTGYNSSFSNIGVLNRTDGATNTNPYFTAVNWWGVANDWYLLVGHVWPAGSGPGAVHVDTGIYNTAGTKIANMNDFVWQITNTRANHRSYLYYSTDITTNQQWYQPRVDLCDGGEPSISELINNAGNKLYDLSGNNLNSTLVNSPTFNNQSIVFNGTNTYVVLQDQAIPIQSTSYTLEAWIKRAALNAEHGIIGDQQYDWQTFHVSSSNKLVSMHRRLSDNAENLITSNANISTNWTHVAVVFDITSGKKLYINGALDKTSSSTVEFQYIAVNRGPKYVGMSNPSAFNVSSRIFNGNISAFKGYTRALSDIEIRENFNATRGRYGI